MASQRPATPTAAPRYAPPGVGLLTIAALTLFSNVSIAAERVPLVDPDAEISEAVLEAFLAPGEFPDRRIVHKLQGESAVYSLDIGLSAAKPFVILHPDRILLPSIADLDLVIEGAPIRFDVSGQRVTDARLDSGFIVRVLLRPLGQRFEPTPRFAAEIVEAEVIATDTGDRLLYFEAERAAPLCGRPSSAGAPTCTVPRIGREARALSLSPDGAHLAIAFGGLRPRLEMWSVEKQPRRIWQALLPQNSGGAVETSFTSDGEYVVVLTGLGRLHRFDARSGGRHLKILSAGRSACPIPPGQIMAVAGDAGEVKLWYLEDGTIAWRLPPRDSRGAVDRIAASGDGTRIALLEYTDTQTIVRIFAIHRRSILRQFELDTLSISDIALNETGETLYLSHDSRGLLSTIISKNSEPMAVPTDPARRCTGQLAWRTKNRGLSCATDAGIQTLDERGRLKTHLSTADETAGWMVAVADEGGRIAAVGGGKLLVWWLSD